MRAEALLAWLSAILFLDTESAILVLGTASGAEQAQCVECVHMIGVYKLDLPELVSQEEARTVCQNHARLLHLLDSFADLTEAEKALCGDQLVPLGCPSGGWKSIQTLNDDNAPYNATLHNQAVNLTSGKWCHVGPSHEYACVLCQYYEVIFPRLSTINMFDDVTMSRYFVAHVTRADTRDSDDVGEVEKAMLGEELGGLFKTLWQSNDIEFERAFLDGTEHLHIEFRVKGEISLKVTTGNATSNILNGSYVVRVEDKGWCPAGETMDADGVVTQLPELTAFDFKFTTNFATGAITRRDCTFNHDTFRAVWDDLPSRWELVWRNCPLDEQYVNEEDYRQFLDAVDVDRRHANALQELASTPVNTTTLQEVARLVDREVNVRYQLYEQTMRHLVNITAHLAMDSDSQHSVATVGCAELIVADLGGSDPTIGFTLKRDLNASDSNGNVTLSRKPTVQGEERALFAVDVSPRLAEAHTRMAFVVLWKPNPTYANLPDWVIPLFGKNEFQYIEVTVMFPRKGEVSVWAFASYGNHHVDITYDNATFSEQFPNSYRVCVAWSNDLRDWTMEGCKTLYSGIFSACRCSGKYFALQDGVPIAKYALKKGCAVDNPSMQNNPFTDFLMDKIALMTATAIECLLSLLGLCSIIGTAILFRKWRKNTGHKILLHMVLALTCNLVLGFTASFMRMNTEGIGCLVYGVLRHYSFLAMFLWMLVLSLLQMKRLMTMTGAKATMHLILKVALFAWGVPLVPIVILLAVNPGFYQTDRFERGYCYPEGLVFQVTVQTPAGLILLVNLGIFVKIVLHIFGCVGEINITRHSKNEKAEQLNKLKTSLFIFFLFGFSWVFHILSEERVFLSDFLFEYLFLMTATTHIFVLALFFVVFQESTRADWIDWFRKIVLKQ